MPTERSFTIRIPAKGDQPERMQAVVVSVDFEQLAIKMGRAAAASKGGKSIDAGGHVVVKLKR